MKEQGDEGVKTELRAGERQGGEKEEVQKVTGKTSIGELVFGLREYLPRHSSYFFCLSFDLDLLQITDIHMVFDQFVGLCR